jgi:hypothetical protein
MSTCRHRSMLALAAGVLLVGCSGGTPSGEPALSPAAAPSASATTTDVATPPGGPDAATLVQQALTARDASDIPALAVTLEQAAAACADPQAAARIAQVAAVAQRWADALADGRPKVQATSEALLADVPWDALARDC